MRSKGQTVSTDALIAIAIFLIVVAFFLIIGTDLFPRDKNLDSEAKKLEDAVSVQRGASPPLVEGSRVNEEVLSHFVVRGYDDLKEDLGVQADFCIYFEDETGSVVLLENDTDRNIVIYGVGTEHMSIAGTPCMAAGSRNS